MYPRKLLEAFVFFGFSEPVLLFVTEGEPEARADFTAPFVSAMACDSRVVAMMARRGGRSKGKRKHGCDGTTQLDKTVAVEWSSRDCRRCCAVRRRGDEMTIERRVRNVGKGKAKLKRTTRKNNTETSPRQKNAKSKESTPKKEKRTQKRVSH